MSPVAALLRFVALTAPVAVLVVLGASDFFVGWDGRAVSVRPARSEDPPTRTVLIAESDDAFEREWPSDLTDTLSLPVDPQAIAPATVSEERPATNKHRFTLHFLVDGPTGFQVIPTTSPEALGLGLLVWAVLIALRNMIVAGAPWAIEPRARFVPVVQPPSGQVPARGPQVRVPKKTRPTRSGRR